jgi:glycine oxidase
MLEIGAGVRPACPDNLPRVFRVGQMLHVNGLYRHGFLLAPAMARRVVEILARRGIKQAKAGATS